jgi:hypothetical protein
MKKVYNPIYIVVVLFIALIIFVSSIADQVSKIETSIESQVTGCVAVWCLVQPSALLACRVILREREKEKNHGGAKDSELGIEPDAEVSRAMVHPRTLLEETNYKSKRYKQTRQ